MIRRYSLPAVFLALLCWGYAMAQHPLMDKLANKVIQKYQQASCEELANQKNQPRSQQEQEALKMLRNNAELRTEFINKVAAPIANKLFECDLIP